MDDKQIKKAFDMLNPSEKQKVRLRNRIEEQEQKNSSPFTRRFHFAGAAAAVAVIVVCCGVGVNAASGGAVADTLRQVFSIVQGRQDVAGQAEEIKQRGIEVYAPEIIWVDETNLVFATKRGVLVVDRKEKRLVNTIDLQKIDCIYLDSDSDGMQTHIVRVGKELIIFNADGKVEGPCWRYALKDAANKDWTPVKDESKETAQAVMRSFKESENRYLDTFDQYNGQGLGENRIDANEADQMMYSKRCIEWKTSDGRTCRSYLLVTEDGRYSLVTHDESNGSVKEEKLDLSTSGALAGEAAEVSLPEFSYSGDDPALAAVISYMKEESYFKEPDEVWIPTIHIYKRIENKKEVLLFAEFDEDTYKLNGKILEAASGGRFAGYARILKKDGEYEVQTMEFAGDGADYDKDIARFTEGHPGLYEQYFENDEAKEKEERLEYLRMYVEDNHLNITHYQDYGWQPVKIK